MTVGGGAAALDPEDEARAAFYGLISRLFYAAPDQGILGRIQNARAFEDDRSPLAECWRELANTCRTADPAILEGEHTGLFVGTGKAEVTPYLSHYTMERSADNPLVALRTQLADWGMARQDRVSEPEDHVSSVCEAMRFAIAVQQRDVSEQKSFFDRFLYPGAIAFCDAVIASPQSNFYKPVARFATQFLRLERQAFDMD